VGRALWRLFTSVNFAVVQIICLALLGVVGMTIRQLPAFAFRSLGDYQGEMAKLQALYDPVFGEGVVDVMERLQLFQVFTSAWFSAGLIILVASIIICTLDRTPRLWHQAADIRVIQPEPYYDPELPDRALMAAAPPAPTVAAILRRHRFRVRAETADDGAAYLYGDRNQWTRLATLLTHTGLILFLVAAAVTSRLGVQEGLVVAEGDSLTVGPIGTPGLLLVRNYGFDAPGFESGRPTDFTTDLAVFQDGRELARKVIRVNDPLTVGGFTFHQNGFGPAPVLVIVDRTGATLWDGPVALTEAHEGLPFGLLSVPGRDVGLQVLLDRAADGAAVLLVLPYRVTGRAADGSPVMSVLDPMAIGRGEWRSTSGLDFAVGYRETAQFSVLIASKDPGQGIVWAAFGFLITGIVVTFYLPRRRVWARLTAAGELALVGRSDRYVDFEREFGRLLDDLVAARQDATSPADPPAGPNPVGPNPAGPSAAGALAVGPNTTGASPAEPGG
jgi:cytochrome c biogenesis protein